MMATALVAAAAAVGQYTPAAQADQITNLPGLPAGVTFNMFGGYVPVGGPKQIYYWMVEAETNADTAPLIVWTNGGPGCSGLGGFLTEQGPFRPTKEGNLTRNPHAWNKLANMVFIEQPAGVGFSVPKNGASGDAEAAEDNHAFIVGLLERFPQYKTRALYISSESYGGHYMPTLAAKIVEKGQLTNFAGVFVGNPLTWMPYRNYGEYATFAGHSLLPKPLWDEYTAAGCAKDDSTPKCQEVTGKMGELTQGLDGYALDFPVCTDSRRAGRHERHTLLSHVKAAGGKLGGYFPDSYTPCDGNWESEYLNRRDVQEAIHAKVGTRWVDCGGVNYNESDLNVPMMPIWKSLAAHKNLKLVIYSGDDDSVCAALGSQQFIWDLGLPIDQEWAPWSIDGQVGGYLVKFRGLSFATVHGAGHMVPATRPAQSLFLLEQFLAGKLTTH